MSAAPQHPPPPARSFLRAHGIPMLIASLVSSALTVVVVLGIQKYASGQRQEAERKRLEEALLGKWEMEESTEEPMDDGDGRRE